MNAYLQHRFDRVETALDTLVDSITSYNPSISAASTLLAADDELSRGLDQLTKHQSNHALLLSLREVSNSLDDRIKSTIALLAETRKELLDLSPASDTAAAPPKQVDLHELLDYAQRLAKYSTYSNRAKQEAENETEAKLENEATKAIESSSDRQEEATQHSSVLQSTEALWTSQEQRTMVKSISTLPENQKQWLDPAANIPHFPWPTDDVIRTGALSRIQAELEKGRDPSSRDLSRDAEQDQVLEQQANGIAEQEGMQRRASFATATTNHRPTAEELQAEARRKEEMFSGFDLYNPDEDD